LAWKTVSKAARVVKISKAPIYKKQGPFAKVLKTRGGGGSAGRKKAKKSYKLRQGYCFLGVFVSRGRSEN